jgi:hypothetical protein
MLVDRRRRRGPLRPTREHAGIVALAVIASLAAACAFSLVLALPAQATPTATPEKTTLRVVALKAPTRLKLDHLVTVSVTVKNRGTKTVPTVAVRLSVGPLPDPGFKISWATTRSPALKPGASRNFTFHIKISSRFDKEHTDKVSGQILSFYGAGNYVIEACTGPTLTSDDACRETPTIRAS